MADTLDRLTSDELKAYLAQKHQCPKDKADKVFKLAWEYGHSAGNHEVEYYYIDLVSLVKE